MPDNGFKTELKTGTETGPDRPSGSVPSVEEAGNELRHNENGPASRRMNDDIVRDAEFEPVPDKVRNADFEPVPNKISDGSDGSAPDKIPDADFEPVPEDGGTASGHASHPDHSAADRGDKLKGQPDQAEADSSYMAGDEVSGGKNRSRLREIMDVLRRNHITRGITPEKLRIILEELGPTYIKLGQVVSLHSDILPKAYCDELMKLNSEVPPMPFSDAVDVLNHSYRMDYRDIFASIDEVPIGSASIAQVHRAKLLSGEDVIVKIERKGIYNTMARDIRLLQRAVKFLPPVANLKNLVDLGQVLDEMWRVAQEEMDFLKEAANMEEFERNNRGIAYIGVPKLYREYTTQQVLVMEYIDGYPINDKKDLLANGYDLKEIGRKFVDNFLKQVIDDGFFHADPHPGNVLIRDGKIIWIDMGMMGRLSDKDRRNLTDGVKGVATNDIAMIENAVLGLGEFKGRPDRDKLYQDIRELVQRYAFSDMGNIDLVDFFQTMMDIMKTNHIAIPHGMTMLVRGLTDMQGVLIEIAPDLNMIEIAKERLKNEYLGSLNWKAELKANGFELYRAFKKGIQLPSLATDIMKEYLNGQSRVNLEIKTSRDFAFLLRRLVRNTVIGLWVAALLVSASIICTTDMKPKVVGIPFLGFAGYLMAFLIVIYVVIRHFATRKK